MEKYIDNNYVFNYMFSAGAKGPDYNSREFTYEMGISHLQTGKYIEASEYFRKTIAFFEGDPESHYHLAYCYQLLNNYDLALEEYQKALALNPLKTDALNNTGIIFTNQGKFNDAEMCFNLLLKFKPGDRNALINFGNIKFKLKEFGNAIELYSQALTKGNNDPVVFFNLGICYFETENYEKAIQNFKTTLVLDENHLGALTNLGLVYYKLEEFGKSLRYFNKSLELFPEHALNYFNIANIYRSLKKYEVALIYYKKTIDKDPKIKLANVYIADILYEKGNLKEAEYFYNLATGDKASKAITFTNLGLDMTVQFRFKEALRYFEIALTADENIPEIHYNKSHIYLLQGLYEKGWQEYEWRLKRYDYPKRNLKKPFLRSDIISGKKILVTDEQGFGDSIQFVRYLSMLKRRGAYVIFECRKKLLPLFENLSGYDQLIEIKPNEEPVIEYDFYIPLLSLPNYFKTNQETIPNSIPYIFPKADIVKHWKNKIKNNKKFKAGLVWGGSPGNTNDKNRSVSLENFLPLLELSGIDFYSLQKGAALKQLNELQVRINIFNEFDNIPFLDSAAIIQNLDLVITVDTSITHLAGAMGKPVWVLLPFIPDWRWMLGRNDTPWYPTMELFRQDKPNNWKEVVSRIKNKLLVETSEKLIDIS